MHGRTRAVGAIGPGSAVVLALAIALLAGCSGKKTAASNVVEMRDMEVVDGTANDAMTDLDAVRTDGIGVGSNEINAGAPAAKPGAQPGSAKETEAVPAG